MHRRNIDKNGRMFINLFIRHVDPEYLLPIIFPYKSIQSHHSQDLNSACAVPVQKIRRFKLALLLVARTIAFPLPTPIPFALHT